MPAQEQSNFKRLALLSLAFSLLTTTTLLMNVKLFPLIDSGFPLAREVCVFAYAVVLVVMGVLCARTRMDHIARVFDALAFSLPVLGVFSMLLGYVLANTTILAVGAVIGCLGADFVKVNPPAPTDDQTSAELLKVASMASGRCGLVCAGGSTVDARTFLSQLYDQIHVGGACGNATGRNIHQRSLDEAVRLTKAISAITFADYDVDEAMDVFEGKENFSI